VQQQLHPKPEGRKTMTHSARSNQGVNWHDGKRFTAADVKCTWDLLQGKTKEKLRLNAREAWWANLDNVSVGIVNYGATD
jgi:peptide/nickel transport system substrate-binding protein